MGTPHRLIKFHLHNNQLVRDCASTTNVQITPTYTTFNHYISGSVHRYHVKLARDFLWQRNCSVHGKCKNNLLSISVDPNHPNNCLMKTAWEKDFTHTCMHSLFFSSKNHINRWRTVDGQVNKLSFQFSISTDRFVWSERPYMVRTLNQCTRYERAKICVT